ncbi:hypothetical protein C6542_18155 [Escherichia coli]|uniref:hypothetical protein n=1 Tax=Escherichia coli TaxID=562 RepID=UPI0015D50F06|nr:hypothetical protein [Escherichia coli]EFJ3039813.1 hypothetical protein [Escherichia coli]EFK0564947.1 hypothetical protein [Escherichia coli]EFK8617396.1 hypothetical protein [Escherichia coli]NYY09871.1 hypothetical protein [Escherichia coli]HAW3343680.1 hypothetical protein [Escherichia coli]
MSDDKKIEFSTSDVLNALLHKGQSLQHLATQESVENLRRETKEGMDTIRRETSARFEQIDKRLDRMEQETERRFNKLESKFDRLQWFIVAAALALIFKDYIFRIIGAQ